MDTSAATTATATTATPTSGTDIESTRLSMEQSTFDAIAIQNFATELNTMQTMAKVKNDAVVAANQALSESSNGNATGIKADATQFGRLLG